MNPEVQDQGLLSEIELTARVVGFATPRNFPSLEDRFNPEARLELYGISLDVFEPGDSESLAWIRGEVGNEVKGGFGSG